MSRKPAPAVVGEPIPSVCTVHDVCRHLNISRATFFRLMAAHRLPLAPIDQFTRQRRFTGESVARAKASKWAVHQRRSA